MLIGSAAQADETEKGIRFRFSSLTRQGTEDIKLKVIIWVSSKEKIEYTSEERERVCGHA